MTTRFDGLPDFAGWTQQQVADFWLLMNRCLNARGAQAIGTAFTYLPGALQGVMFNCGAGGASSVAVSAGEQSQAVGSAKAGPAGSPWDPSWPGWHWRLSDSGTAFAPPDERGKPEQGHAQQVQQADGGVTVSAGKTRQANAPYDPSQTWTPEPQAVVFTMRRCPVCPVCAQPLLLP